MTDDARLAELRGLMAETLRATGVWWSEDTDGPADRLLPVVSAWAEQDREQHAARRAAEELRAAAFELDQYADEQSGWCGPFHDFAAGLRARAAALTPATEEER